MTSLELGLIIFIGVMAVLYNVEVILRKIEVRELKRKNKVLKERKNFYKERYKLSNNLAKLAIRKGSIGDSNIFHDRAFLNFIDEIYKEQGVRTKNALNTCREYTLILLSEEEQSRD